MVEGEVQLLEDRRQTLPEQLEDLKDRLLAFSSRKPPQVLQNSLTPLSFPLAFIKKKIPAYV